MNKLSRSIQAITKSPLLWGVLGSAGFYALIHAGPLDVPFVKRYFTHHPVEYMETVMFSIGLAALLIKAFDTVAQRAGLSESLLGSVPRTANPAEECNALLAGWTACPAGAKASTTSAGCVRRWSTSATAARPTRWTTS